MNTNDKTELDRLLTKLLWAQDSITHMNERGPGDAADFAKLIADRDSIKNQIHIFVTGLGTLEIARRMAWEIILDTIETVYGI